MATKKHNMTESHESLRLFIASKCGNGFDSKTSEIPGQDLKAAALLISPQT